MPPKKKKKGKVTVEELRQRKRDQLSRELQHGIKARTVLEKKWKQMMMDIKVPEMMKELQAAWNNSEYILDLKDYMISILMDELDDAEEQYLFNYKAHCQSIQNIYKVYLFRLYDLKNDYDKELKFYEDSLKEQASEIRKKSEEQQEYLKTMIFELTTEEKNLSNLGRSIYMSKLNELEQKYIDETELRKKKEEDWFEGIWKKYVKHLEKYQHSIKEKEHDFYDRMEKDDAISNIIKKQSNQLYHLQIVLRTTKEHKVTEEERVTKKINDLNDEYNYWHNFASICKNLYTDDLKLDEEKLTSLVIESNNNLKKLDKYEKLAEKILKLYSLTRKLETRREKTLPFPKSRPRIKFEYDWGNRKNLNNFWQKCAMADTTRNNIHDEYLQLLDENFDLKQTIRKCINYECNQKWPQMIVSRKKRLQGSQSEIFIENL